MGYLNRRDRETLIAMTALNVWLEKQIERWTNKEAKKYIRMAGTLLKKAAIIILKETDEKLIATVFRQCRDYEFQMQPIINDRIAGKQDIYYMTQEIMDNKCIFCEGKKECDIKDLFKKLGVQGDDVGICPYIR